MPSTRFPRASGSKEVSPGSQILLSRRKEKDRETGEKVSVGEKMERLEQGKRLLRKQQSKKK